MRFCRRDLWRVLAVGWVAAGIAGCDFSSPSSDSSPEAETPRPVSSVPLRVVSTATAELNDRIELAWSTVSEQPLEIRPATPETLREEAGRADVVVFHNGQMGDLQAIDALTPLPETFLRGEGVDADSFLPALVNGATKWGDEIYALPLGTPFPAIWIGENVEVAETPSWSDYSEWIASVPEGQAAEPLAEGWAAVALLHRAASHTGATWLFDHSTLEPVIESEPYVRALEGLVADRQRYPQELWTPAQVWNGLRTGEVRIALGWPTGGDGGPSAAVRMLPYPTAEEVFVDGWQPAGTVPRPPLVSSRGLLVGLAASCRQTSAARALMTWLASRDGHAAIRTASPNLAANRREIVSEEVGGLPLAVEGDLARGTYDQFVIEMLGDGQVRPGLRLPGAEAYHAALDVQVRAALAGEATPAEALATAAAEWDRITERLGRQQQLRAWRLAQGYRGR